MKQLLIKASMVLAVPIIAIGYTNCSKVAFDSLELSSEEKKLAINQGGIVINDDATFTNNVDVNLRLIHNSAEEMYVTNDSSCESGGNWEDYKPNLEWKLNSQNAEAKVFVRYREKGSTEIVSDCYADAIIHDNVAPEIKFQRQAGEFFNTANFGFQHNITDNLSGVGVVRCNADGAWSSACNATTKIHTLPEGLHHIRIEATDRAGNKSEPLEDSFTIDLTNPTLRFVMTPPAVTSDLIAKFAFAGEDALSGISKFECRLDGASFVACASPTAFNVSESNHVYEVRAYDRAGNVSAPISYEWTVDRTAPTVEITKGPKPFVNTRIADFEFKGNDGAMVITKFECRVDAGPWAACSSPHSTASLADGEHKFEVRGYDAADNPSSPAPYTWVIDAVKPTVTLVSKPPVKSRDKNAMFAFSATDDRSGIDMVMCRQTGSSTYATCSSPKSYSALPDGTYKFEIYAKDKAGNQSAIVSHTYKVDATKPIVEIVSGPDALTRDNTAQLVFNAYDPNGGSIAKIECQLNNGGFGDCASPKDYSNLDDITHLFQVRATDDVGNVSDIKSYSWTVDSSGPAINFLKQPPSVVKVGDAMPIHYIVTDDGSGVKSVRCGLNGSLESCPVEMNVNLELGIGEYVSRVEAEDNLGNKTVAEVRWRVEIKTQPVSQPISVATNNKVDVLVVVDNSGSMEYEQLNMATRFGSLLDKLKGLDWRVGIITTDMKYDSDLRWGRLVKMSGTNQYFIDSSMNYANAKQIFANTVQRPGWEGDSNEQGIRATYYSISRAVYWDQSQEPNARNRAFYRDDAAALSVILVSDAFETYKNSGEDANRPEKLLELVQGRWPNKAFSFHSIVVRSGDWDCLNSRPAGYEGNEEFGVHYETMSALTGGIVGSVCESDYAAQLGSIGQATVDQVRSANLNCAPLDTNGDGRPDVQIITSNGSTAPGYSVSGLKITFTSNLPAGTNTLKYSCLAE